MVIAIPKEGSYVNENFLTSKSFTIINVKDNKISESFDISSENLQHNYLGLSNMLISEKVSVIIADYVGEKAYKYLTRSGLEVISGVGGNVDEIVFKFLNNELPTISM